VLGLLAVPYLALPLYLLFGRRKLTRKPAAGGTPPPGRHWAEDLIVSFGLPCATDSRIRLHRDGAEARAALFEVFAKATTSLDICTYILGNDPFGAEVSARLAERVRAGVRVRLLLDGVGALQLPRGGLRRLHEGGISTAVFSPLLARKTSGPRNLRNHRKLVLADGAVLWAGGRNLAAEYFLGRAGEPPWCDLSFDLEGPVAAAAAAQFESDWLASHGTPAELLPLPQAGAPPAPAAFPAHSVQFLPSGPDQSEDTVQALLLDACFRAERRVLAVTPYFVPDSSLGVAMRLAARRGVRIAVCLPATSNHVLADFARARTLRSLAAAGVEFHLLPYMVHAKGVVFDDSLAICGSPNLDSRSLLLNYESAFVLYGAAEIRWLSEWITALIEDSVPFEPRPPTLLRDLTEGLLLTVAYQL
jgi:cardiolipin synthase